jgi:hypothetical protein
MRDERKVQLVAVRTYSGNSARLDAELAKGVLTEAGIECVIPGEVAADTFPFLDVPLLVRDEDVERAAEILENAFAPDQSEEGGESAEE